MGCGQRIEILAGWKVVLGNSTAALESTQERVDRLSHRPRL